MDKPQKQLSDSDRAAARKLDIAFIIIGAAIIAGCGILFGRGVAEHLKYLTADDKMTVIAEFVEAKSSRGNYKTDADGDIVFDEVFDVTYEYCIDDQPHTFVRENESTYNQENITLRLYRNGSEPYQQTDMYGMWAGVHWFLLFLSVYIGIKMILSGAKSLRKQKTEAEKPAA